jgi:putative addiction module component (TIGR02574 family)
MTTVNLKKNIHKAVDKIDDPELLRAVYTILEREIENAEQYELTPAQKKELDRRLANHKSGKSKSYSWEEVKGSLLNRDK